MDKQNYPLDRYEEVDADEDMGRVAMMCLECKAPSYLLILSFLCTACSKSVLSACIMQNRNTVIINNS